jgi:hypothetical protein
MARSITQHWVRSLIAAVIVIVLLGAAAGAGAVARPVLPNVSLEGHLVQGLDEPQVAAATAEERREAAVSSSGSPR